MTFNFGGTGMHPGAGIVPPLSRRIFFLGTLARRFAQWPRSSD